MNEARLWLRINRVLRVMLHTRWSAEAWVLTEVSHAADRARGRGRRTSPYGESMSVAS